jgi:hypothetical protein
MTDPHDDFVCIPADKNRAEYFRRLRREADLKADVEPKAHKRPRPATSKKSEGQKINGQERRPCRIADDLSAIKARMDELARERAAWVAGRVIP